MTKVVHVVGNGDWVDLYNREERKGLKLACNLPPFPIGKGHYATCMVDFKFMAALREGSVYVHGDWVLGYRPKIWMDRHPEFYMKTANHVKEFYTELPKYAPNYTDFNCGHMAVHYACNKLKADVVHMYGFDSIFDFNLRSKSDFILNSDRENMNNNRLASNWRPIWTGLWHEFKNTEFILHHFHGDFKVKHPDNVKAKIYSRK